MCTHPFAKEALTLHLARSEGHERYFGCNLMHRKVLASSHQHLMTEAPYVVSQREIYADWGQRLKVLPMLLSLGTGMCLNNAKAVMEAFLGRETGFVRTPKYRIESSADQWSEKRYRARRSLLPYIELGLGLYFTLSVAYAAAHQIYGSLPFLALFQVGFLYTGALSLAEDPAFRIQHSAFRILSKLRLGSRVATVSRVPEC